MKSFTPNKQLILLFSLATLAGATAIPACMMSADLFGADRNGDDPYNSSPGGGYSAGTGDSGQGGSIKIGSDSGYGSPSKDFADLCGQGPCSVGEDGSECQGNGGAGPSAQACHLILSAGKTVATCGPVGEFSEGGPCKSAKDCGAGLGCTATPGGGVCRSYCCGDVEMCPAKTYCDPQPMAEDSTNDPPVKIPACIPATNCVLLNDEKTCGSSLTCTIVRADGTTSCVEPGSGMVNDPCPCAAGFVCSKLKNECKKLCRIGNDAVDCGNDATCQAGSMGYPQGFGICVGGSSS